MIICILKFQLHYLALSILNIYASPISVFSDLKIKLLKKAY